MCSVTRRTPVRISRKCSSMRTSPVRRPCVRTAASRSFLCCNAREKVVSGAHLPHHRCRHGDGVVLQTERHRRPAGAGAAQTRPPDETVSRGAWKPKFTRSQTVIADCGIEIGRARRLCSGNYKGMTLMQPYRFFCLFVLFIDFFIKMTLRKSCAAPEFFADMRTASGLPHVTSGLPHFDSISLRLAQAAGCLAAGWSSSSSA